MVTRKLIGLMLLFAVTCRAAEQELIVVADLGGQSTADYFAAIDPPSEPENEAPLLTLSTPERCRCFRFAPWSYRLADRPHGRWISLACCRFLLSGMMSCPAAGWSPGVTG